MSVPTSGPSSAAPTFVSASRIQLGSTTYENVQIQLPASNDGNVRVILPQNEVSFAVSSISGLDFQYAPLQGCRVLLELSEVISVSKTSSFCFALIQYDIKYANKVEDWVTQVGLKSLAEIGLEIWLTKKPWMMLNSPAARQAIGVLLAFFRIIAMVSIPMQILYRFFPNASSFLFDWISHLFSYVHPFQLVSALLSWIWNRSWPVFIALVIPTVLTMPYWGMFLAIGVIYSGTLYAGLLVVIGFFIMQEIMSFYRHFKRLMGVVRLAKELPRLIARTAGSNGNGGASKKKQE